MIVRAKIRNLIAQEQSYKILFRYKNNDTQKDDLLKNKLPELD